MISKAALRLGTKVVISPKAISNVACGVLLAGVCGSEVDISGTTPAEVLLDCWCVALFHHLLGSTVVQIT